MPFGNSKAESQRDAGTKPRVARNEPFAKRNIVPVVHFSPGKSRQKANNPNGVAARWRKFDTTPLGLKIPSAATQGSSFLATLGRRAQSLWDCRTAGASRVPLDFSFPSVPPSPGFQNMHSVKGNAA